MDLLKILILSFLCGVIHCNISPSSKGFKWLSRIEIAEITKIAEDNVQQEMRKSTIQEEQEPEIFVEQTPPPITVAPPPVPTETTPMPVIEEIEDIRLALNGSGSVECNITARYMWDLCRPILLRTCKERFRTQCSRRQSGRYSRFNRGLGREFPPSRPPDIRFFHPKPLPEWTGDEIRDMVDDRGFHFSISISNHTYTSDDVARELRYLHQQFQRSLKDMHRRFMDHSRSRFPSRHGGSRFMDHSRSRFSNRHDGPRRHLPDWLRKYFGSDREEDDDEDEGVNGTVEVPARRVQPAVGGSPKATAYNPSYIGPKALPKPRRRPALSRQKRHGGYRGSSQRTYGRRHGMMNHTPRRRTMMMRPMHRRNPAMYQRDHPVGIPPSPYWNHGFMMPPTRNGVRHFPPMSFHHYWRWSFGGRDDEDDDDDDDEDDDDDDDDDHDDDDDDDEYDDDRMEFSCEEMEENPEVCIEITERTEKCENELERVCPEYVAKRILIKEKLEKVFSSRHQVNQFADDDDDTPSYQTSERHEWRSYVNGGKHPIVIDSIAISRGRDGSASVTAKLFEDTQETFRVPFTDTGSLGKAIGQHAMKYYNARQRGRHY